MGETFRAESGGTSEEGYTTGAVPPGYDKQPPPEADEGKIAGKFTSQEELVKAYKELEQMLGSRKAETPAPVQEEKPAEAAPENTEGLIQKAEDKGIDVDALTQEYIEKGALSDETIAGLEKRGIPRQMVEAYVEGQKALADNAVNVLAEVAGGRDEFSRVLEWAGENLSDEEIEAYNSAMKAGNVGQTKVLLRGIVAAYRTEVGEAPRGLTGERGSPTPEAAFTSDAAMNKAIQDPRYRTDPDYRASVERRIAAMLRG